MKSLYFITLIVLSFTACKNQEPAVEKPKTTVENHVKTVSVSHQHTESTISSLGVVMSNISAKPSFKTSGVIKSTLVKEGDMVKKGQLIATLVLDEINAQVTQAEEGLTKSWRDLERAKRLYADSVATLEQLQNATSAYEVAKKTVEIGKFNRNFSEVRSPIQGKVMKQLMRAGEIVGPGMPIYAILGIDKQDWVIQLGLVDEEWARINIGDMAKVTLDAYPGQVYDAKVSNKSAASNGSSGTFDIELKFIQQPAKLAAGLMANTHISVKKEASMTTIPIDAVLNSNGQDAEVFTIENNKAKRIKIKIAKLLGNQVAVQSGLENVTEVITIGAMYLEDGDAVIK